MTRTTLLFGLALIATGVGFYIGTGRQSVTALIPAFIGLAIAVLAAVATRGDKARMHAMHVVAILCLAALVPTWKGIADVLGGGRTAPALARAITFVLCLLLLVLCVNSFVQARVRSQSINH